VVEAMAKAVSQSTPITWITPLAARALLAKCCGGSEPYAERLILEGLAAGDASGVQHGEHVGNAIARQPVRWRAAGIRPIDHPLDGFWRQLESFDWATGTAVAWVSSGAFVGFDYGTAYGVQFAQEDIEALCPAHSAPPSPSVQSETALSFAAALPPLPAKEWVAHAIKVCGKELAGMSDRAAARRLEKWARDGKDELRAPQKPIGRSRIRAIALEQGLLPVKSVGN
jgi:hypothetical protein